MSLSRVRNIAVPDQLLAETESALRGAGRREHELFVLWSGHLDGKVFRVRTSHVPEQFSYRTIDGCGVRVEAEALHRLNVWLFEHAELLGVQVHSHPTEAYHSLTDDAYPIVTTEGGLSIVVADFCRDGLQAPTTAAYQLVAGVWREARPTLAVA
jgi:hypothetical protein